MQLAPGPAAPTTSPFKPVTVGHVLDGVHPGAKSNPIVTTGVVASGQTRDSAIQLAKELSIGADKPGVAVAMLHGLGEYQVYEIARQDATSGVSGLYHFEGIEHMAGAPFPFSSLRRDVLFVDGNSVFGWG